MAENQNNKKGLGKLVEKESEKPEVKKEVEKNSWIKNYDLDVFV